MSRTNILKKYRLPVWEKSNGLCHYCKCEMILDSYGSNPPWDTNKGDHYTNGYKSRVFSIDHIIPYSKGGKCELENFVGCCITCNKKKKNKEYYNG